MDSRYPASPLRELYDQTLPTRAAARDLTGFKSQAVNFKLGFWNPHVNGIRYLKALIYNLAAGLSADNWARLRRIRNREVGDPIVVVYGGEPVCIDYLQAVLELEFVSGVPLAGQRVLEIGAGYGRTCHAMLSNHDLDEYWIADLGSSLELAKGYLGRVLERQQLGRVRFVTPDELADLPAGVTFGLSLGVNAFAEMPAGTVRNYLALVAARSRYFYVRDAVGKYRDPALDGQPEGTELVELALQTGLLREVLDIHDSRAVEQHAGNFVTAYQPDSGWTCLASAWAPPWSFYWQALYQDRSPDREGRP